MNLLECDVGEKVLPPIDVSSKPTHGLYCSSVDFYMMLAEFDFCDVLTYSVTASEYKFCEVRRLIIGCVPMWKYKHLAKQIKINTNNHAKIFIAYRNKKPIEAFVGSLNLTNGINFNIMLKTSIKVRKELVQLFETIWKISQFPTK